MPCTRCLARVSSRRATERDEWAADRPKGRVVAKRVSEPVAQRISLCDGHASVSEPASWRNVQDAGLLLIRRMGGTKRVKRMPMTGS